MSRDAEGRFCAPVLAVSGLSGSGKTSLLEAVLPRLIGNGISVAVVKHDAHGISVDVSGKDSDRLFRAGATVAVRGPDQQFLRRQSSASLGLYSTLEILSRDHDLLIVEGHKNTPLPKFWLKDSRHTEIPSDVTNIVEVLEWDTDRVDQFLAFVERWLPVEWRQRPVLRGLLLGKEVLPPGPAILSAGDRPQRAAIKRIALVGHGAEVQQFPRIPGALGTDDPLAELLAAHRWAPTAAWILTTCDDDSANSALVDCLTSMRAPGRWSVIPRQRESTHGVIAGLYEPQALALLERHLMETSKYHACMDRLLGDRHTVIFDVPSEQIEPGCDIHQQTTSSYEETNAKS